LFCYLWESAVSDLTAFFFDMACVADDGGCVVDDGGCVGFSLWARIANPR